MFLYFVIFIVFGSLSFYYFAEALINFFIYWIPLLFLVFYLIQRRFNLNLLILLLSWLLGFGLAWLSWSFFPTIENKFLAKPVQIVGEVVSLPEHGKSSFGSSKVQFLFRVQKMAGVDYAPLAKPLIKLSWYDSYNEFLPDISTGDIWCLPVKLKPNHASFNPSGFDYEQYLFTKKIVANGYIATRYGQVQLLEEAGFDLHFWLAKKIDKLFKKSELIGLFKALLIGDKSKMTSEQWQVFQQTGTIHLMAISGLHIGIMAMLGFVVFGWLWQGLIRIKPFFYIRNTPKILFSAVGVLLLISFYLYISGFAVSTQRAWIMAVVLIFLLFLRRKFQPWSALALAGLLVVIWQPTSILAVGFWLSFTAVALIFLALENVWIKQLNNWQKLIAIQVVLTVGMMPILAFYFQQVPLTSMLANIVAIPVVSMIALPLLFFTLIISLLFANIAMPLVIFTQKINDFVWFWLWEYLQWLSSWFEYANGYWLIGKVEIWQIVLLYFIWWILYKSAIKLVCSLLIALVSFVVAIVLVSGWQLDKPTKVGEVRLTVLDVGQGQAVVLETKNHVVVYDTGPRWGDKLDGAKLAVLPYLKQQQIKDVDLLMISHSDMDHAGGVASLLENIEVKEKVSGEPVKLNKLASGFSSCHQQQWLFDEVEFRVISNPEAKVTDNDKSCVLQVITGTQSIMITGDASKKVEEKLVKQFGSQLESSILLAGHHGSNSSSTKNWLSVVKAEMAVFSTGYANRFGFPKPEVVQRVKNAQARWLNTACTGAIRFTITTNNWQLLSQERIRQHKIFHHQCKD